MRDFPAIVSIALNNSESICRELLPLGKRRGKEFVVGDIDGSQGDSMSINLDTGIWTDFAGSVGGKDIISLVAACRGISQSEAYDWIEARFGGGKSPQKQTPKETWVPMQAPSDPDSVEHPKLGMPIDAFAYRNKDGSIINVVCRFEPKEFRALSYGNLNGNIGWHWKQLPSPRPLYNDYKDPARTIIVEGEKAAEALKIKLPDANVITWQAGASSASKSNWKEIFGQEFHVTLWPDNDDPGKKAMNDIAAVLKDKVGSLRIVDVSILPEKSDAADYNGDVEEFLDKRSKPMFQEKKKESIGLDFDPMELEGMIGDTVRWITKYAIKKQPELALLNTLAFAGTVFGRTYESQIRTRTNIYTVGIADTGMGKDNSRKMIRELAENSELESFIGANKIRSDSGLLRSLMNNTSQLMMIDEFGMFLQGIGNDKAPPYIRSQAAMLLELYSSSNSIYNHGDYADPKAKPIIINNPCLCIYGTSTERIYAEALKKSAIESGELNRFIVLPGKNDKQYPAEDEPMFEHDDGLLESWRRFSPSRQQSIGGLINSSDFLPEPKMIHWGVCKAIKHDIQCEQEDKINEQSDTRHLWGRMFENTVKIAMIFAISRDHLNPQFTERDFDIAQSIVRYSINYMSSLAEHRMSDSNQEALNNEILMFIKSRQGVVSRTDLVRRFRKLKSRELEDLIKSMTDQEVIFAQMEKEEGKRTKITYRTELTK